MFSEICRISGSRTTKKSQYYLDDLAEWIDEAWTNIWRSLLPHWEDPARHPRLQRKGSPRPRAFSAWHNWWRCSGSVPVHLKIAFSLPVANTICWIPSLWRLPSYPKLLSGRHALIQCPYLLCSTPLLPVLILCLGYFNSSFKSSLSAIESLLCVDLLVIVMGLRRVVSIQWGQVFDQLYESRELYK